MDPMTAEETDELRQAAGRVDLIHARTNGMFREVARPGSTGEIDAAIPHARWVRSSADTSLGIATDHLLAWRLIVDGGRIPIFSPMTLLRSVLEAAVLCRWLVDPRPEPMVRVGRGIAAQMDDYDERRKFENSARAGARPPGAGKAGADRMAELASARDADGIPIVRLPGPTDLARLYGVPGHADSTWLYRLVSAFAHAKPWALNATDLGDRTAGALPGLFGAQIRGNTRILINATNLVAWHVETAVVEVRAYIGIA